MKNPLSKIKVDFRIALAAILIIICIIELILAFTGPMALKTRSSIMVSTTYSQGVSQEDLEKLRLHTEAALAKSAQYNIISQELIIDYMREQQDQPDFEFTSDINYKGYIEIARTLEIDKVAILVAYPYEEDIMFGIYIRSASSGDMIYRYSLVSESVEDFLEGNLSREYGEEQLTSIVLSDLLKEDARGVEVFDYLFFLLIAGQLLLIILLLLKKSPDIINTACMMTGFFLFLFSFIYAQNAGLDYVQRFIASQGRINLAPDAFTEKLYAVLRFIPFLSINLLIYIRKRIKKQDSEVESGEDQPLETDRFSVLRFAGKWGLLLSIFSAVLFALSFPSFISLRGFPLLAWIAFVPLLLSVIGSKVPAGIFNSLIFGMLSTLILNYWHGTYSYISLAFSVGLSSILFLVFVFPWVLSMKLSGKWGFIPAALLWLAFEYCKSLGYIAYPWGLAGVSQYSILPVIQVADIGGVWAVSLLVILFNSGLSWFIAGKEKSWKWFGRSHTPILVGAGLLLIALLYGTAHLIIPEADSGESMRMALVQQNTDPRKHDYKLSYQILEDMSLEAIDAAGDEPIDMLVWPEGGFKTDVRFWMDNPEFNQSENSLIGKLKLFMADRNIWLLTGTQDHIIELDKEGEKERRNFNSSALIAPGGLVDQLYHKIHLVPFTESFPYKEEMPGLAKLLDKFNTSNWKAGNEHYIYTHPKAKFFTPICFEDIFPDDIRRFALQEPDIIVNISNDYWSLTPVEGKQHAVHALFRSIENRIPTVRSTASGLTTYIDPEGRMSKDFPAYYEPGWMLVDIPLVKRSMTLYTRLGDWLPLAAIVFSTLWFIAVLFITLKNRFTGNIGKSNVE